MTTVVVLIGSVARESAMVDSDLDLLVLASPKLVVPYS
jgi:predicted nucleotidyltransferase